MPQKRIQLSKRRSQLHRAVSFRALLTVAAVTVIALIGASTGVAGVIEYDGKFGPDGTPNPPPLLTVDRVHIVLSYYPGGEGQKSVPVILLHDKDGSRADFRQLAEALQKIGCAVIVPDLRGHGDSTKRQNSNVPINASRLSRNDYTAMVLQDMDAIRRFLWEKNNEKKLNAEAVCIVGAGMGASVAVCWTSVDWARQPVGYVRQGQDVKALVLISPNWATPGLPLSQVMKARAPRFALTDPNLQRVLKKRKIPGNAQPVAPQLGDVIDHDFRREVAILLLVGKKTTKTKKDTDQLHTIFEIHHEDTLAAGEKDLFYGAFDTTLQGTKMLGRPELGIEGFISKFVNLKLIKMNFGWGIRKINPYGN